MSDKGKIATKLIAPIDTAELAVRMIEAARQMKRPSGATAVEALAGLEPEDQQLWSRIATAAMDYWRECIQAAQVPS